MLGYFGTHAHSFRSLRFETRKLRVVDDNDDALVTESNSGESFVFFGEWRDEASTPSR
jgi:hypothetical protein